MNNRKLIALTAAAAIATVSALGSGVAFAQDNSGSSDQVMSLVKTVQTLEENGYTKIDSIDRDLDRYEVDATDPNGQRVELVVDGRTGEVLRSERDDD